MIRFQNGTPFAIHLSAHSDGHAWAWNMPEKMGERPVAYVASGSREFTSLLQLVATIDDDGL